MSESPNDKAIDAQTGAPVHQFAASYFDGRQSRPHSVQATVADGRIELSGADIARSFSLSDVRVSERLRHAPRLLTFADGSYCEVVDHRALDAALLATGFSDSWVVRWQQRWGYALAALVATLGVIVFAYLVVLPWGARIIADQIPSAIESRIGEDAVAWVSHNLFSRSELPLEQRERLRARLGEIAPHDGRTYGIEFGASKIGPNAFALPGGAIMMTDELVDLADNEEEILAVLAHEVGHIQHRHLLRRLISGTVTGAAATLIVGDASGVLAAIPATLADLSYSRDMESEADAYAVDLLRANGLSPTLLADMLEKLEAAHGERGADENSWVNSYLSTHPDTLERVRVIRAAEH